MSRGRDLLATLVTTEGFLGLPPGVDGSPGLGIAGVTGAARGRTWDAAGSATAPELTGDTVTFVTLRDGTVVVEDDVPDGSLVPLADAVEVTLEPPYRAAGARAEGDGWAVIAERIAIVELPLDGDVVDLTVVRGERELTIDGERTSRSLPALDALAEQHEDVALHAERVDEDLFAVDAFPL